MSPTEAFCKQFPRRWVLTLERSPERLAEFNSRLSASGLPKDMFEPFFGYDAFNTDGFSNMPWRNRRGDFGCFTSYVQMLQQIALGDDEWVVVVEDDCEFSPDAMAKVMEAWADLPAEAEIFYMGVQHLKAPVRVTDNLVRVKAGIRTHAQIFRRSAALKIHYHMCQLYMSPDQVLRRMAPNCFFLAMTKNVAAQAPVRSTIGRTWKQSMWWHPRHITVAGEDGEDVGDRMARRPMNGQAALQALNTFQAVSKELGVPLWLTDGTLLGAVRDKDFIGHDGDIDFGCFVEDYRWRDDGMTAALRKHGFKLTHKYGSADCGLQLSYHGGGIYVDIFFFYRCSQSGRWWHAAWEQNGRHSGLYRMIQYHYRPFDLETRLFKGLECLSPADAEAYLAQKYGEDWKKVKKKWDWRYDPANASSTNIYAPKNDREVITNSDVAAWRG